jgi:hypothetical protein
MPCNRQCDYVFDPSTGDCDIPHCDSHRKAEGHLEGDGNRVFVKWVGCSANNATWENASYYYAKLVVENDIVMDCDEDGMFLSPNIEHWGEKKVFPRFTMSYPLPTPEPATAVIETCQSVAIEAVLDAQTPIPIPTPLHHSSSDPHLPISTSSTNPHPLFVPNHPSSESPTLTTLTTDVVRSHSPHSPPRHSPPHSLPHSPPSDSSVSVCKRKDVVLTFCQLSSQIEPKGTTLSPTTHSPHSPTLSHHSPTPSPHSPIPSPTTHSLTDPFIPTQSPISVTCERIDVSGISSCQTPHLLVLTHHTQSLLTSPLILLLTHLFSVLLFQLKRRMTFLLNLVNTLNNRNRKVRHHPHLLPEQLQFVLFHGSHHIPHPQHPHHLHHLSVTHSGSIVVIRRLHQFSTPPPVLFLYKSTPPFPSHSYVSSFISLSQVFGIQVLQ